MVSGALAFVVSGRATGQELGDVCIELCLGELSAFCRFLRQGVSCAHYLHFGFKSRDPRTLERAIGYRLVRS
jgi:hypothetical protein